MSKDKFNFPDQVEIIAPAGAAQQPVSEKVAPQQLQNEQVMFKAGADVVKEGFAVIRAFAELQGTKLEWEGRIAVAETELAKAKEQVNHARAVAEPQMAKLKNDEVRIGVMKSFFEMCLAQIHEADIDRDTKATLRSEMLEVCKQLASIK